MTIPTFSALGLAEPLQRALREQSYDTPTPIQTQAIPRLLKGNDLLGIAQTGTGKTAAFTLPLLQKLIDSPKKRAPRQARALILAPTRELAVQISDSIAAYGSRVRHRRAVVLGGVGQGAQIRCMAQGVDILVATPGRLLDLVSQRHIALDGVDTLVLDEADRMLDMGFIRDVRKIVSALPRKRQSLLFSATMPPDVARLAGEMLHQPVRVEVTPEKVTVDRIDQRVFFVPSQAKQTLLSRLLEDPALDRVIVFTRTKRGADRVTRHLDRSGVSATALHGNKAQSARQRALDSFRNGDTRVLVATDIAARGIDVDGVTHVINYELPEVPECYVHRIGRTARAGAKGIAFSFCDPSERSLLRSIEKLTKRPLTAENQAGGEATEEKQRAPATFRPGKQRRRARRNKVQSRRAA